MKTQPTGRRDNKGTTSTGMFPLRYSLFPNVPPYLNILTPGQHYEPPLPQELQQMTWAAPSGISPIVEESVKQAGLALTQGQAAKKDSPYTSSVWETLPITEKGKDEIDFSGLSAEVKINQFPGLFVIGRKDRLWTCYEKMVNTFGRDSFGFLPRTYIVPEDREELEKEMKASAKAMIVKPPNYYCGIGIKLINKIEDIPNKKNKMVVQEYIDNPFLINGLKFDLRLYILLTSIDPVKIYIYEEGLVRFATAQYSNDPAEIGNNFIHLTNYSVNKMNKEFVFNEKPGEYEGHKWNLKTLWKYFEEELGVDWRPVWEATKDVCVKTVLCGQEEIRAEFSRQLRSEYSCYKLFGFDIFFDQHLKPWLLEVNNIPSLHINTIDAFVNRPMVAEMFNILGFHIPKAIASKHQKTIEDKLKLSRSGQSLGHDHRVYSRLRNKDDMAKSAQFSGADLSREDYCDNILADLSPADIRTIIRAEEELSQTQDWTRIFPTPSSHPALQFISPPSYSDRLLDAWESKYGASQELRQEGRDILIDLCAEKVHLRVCDIVE